MNRKRWIALVGLVFALVTIVVVTPAVFAQLEPISPRSERPATVPRGGGHHGMLAVVADVLDMTPHELIEALDEETSIADVAAAHGVALEEIITAVLEQAEERLQTAVENGRLTQAQADERLAELREEVTTRLNEAGLPPRSQRGGGDDCPPPPPPPEDGANT
jgi:hypothetical protein